MLWRVTCSTHVRADPIFSFFDVKHRCVFATCSSSPFPSYHPYLHLFPCSIPAGPQLAFFILINTCQLKTFMRHDIVASIEQPRPEPLVRQRIEIISSA